MAVGGGVFVIPLYAVMQTHSPPDARSRVLAANNIVNAAVSVAVIVLATLLLRAGLDVAGLGGVLGGATGAVAVAAHLLSPRPAARGAAPLSAGARR